MVPQELERLSSVIDEKALLARCLNNLEFAERILGLFQQRGEIELAELDRAFQANDRDAVRRISHRLSGACANAAAMRLQQRASELRHAADGDDLSQALSCLEDLRSEWNRFTTALSENATASNPPREASCTSSL